MNYAIEKGRSKKKRQNIFACVVCDDKKFQARILLSSSILCCLPNRSFVMEICSRYSWNEILQLTFDIFFDVVDVDLYPNLRFSQ